MSKRAATTTRHLHDAREQAAYQFELLADRIGLAVTRKLPNYRYIVHDEQEGQDYTAIVLPASFDFYEFRLHKGQRRADLLIVQRHNAAVPLRVMCLEDVTVYAPLDLPTGIERPDRKRRNQEEVRLLVSKLLLNFESAQAELAQMRPRTRQWYEALASHYLRGRIGRPWAS